MNLEDALEVYQGTKLQLNELSKYEQWAFSFFHDDNFVIDPLLSTTLHLDLKEGFDVYKRLSKDVLGASFQAYLIWNLVKALSLHWPFSTRKIDGEWYRFKNLPLYFPVAVGGDDRFKDVLINDAAIMDWEAFSKAYRNAIENPSADVGGLPFLTWTIAHFIGNLPNLNFTSFHIHRGILKAGRPVFYFGQRFKSQQQWTVPLSITFDHANTDPYVLNELMQTYQNFLIGSR